jgi:DNA-binding NarL/FixJ family response regulator
MLWGRQREQHRLDALLSAAQRGTGGAVLLVGEAGMGKSVLLDYARERAAGFQIATVTGIERESDLGYTGLHQLLRPWFGLIGGLGAAQAHALSSALGLEEAHEPDRFLVSAALLELLAEAATDAPVLVTVDDVQWLDSPSVDAIVFAARRLAADRVAVIATVRDAGDGGSDLALPAVHLSGLDPDAVAAMLANLAGPDVPHAVAEVLAAHTRGNPLGLAELCRLLSSAQLSGRSPLPDPLPPAAALDTGFAQRIARLPASARTAVQIAATAGGAGIETVLRAGAHLGVTVEDLDAAERAGLVLVRHGAIAFHHPLVRSAAYHAATFAERRAAHLALADALADSQDAERRAWQLAAAALGPDEQVAHELERIAHGASARGAHAPAAAAFERAAELTEDRDHRVRRRLAGVASARAAGLHERALAMRAHIDEGHPEAYDSGLSGYMHAAQAMAAFDAERAAELLFSGAVSAQNGGRWDELDTIAARAQALDLRADAPIVRFLIAFSAAAQGRDEPDGETLDSFAERDDLEVSESIATGMRSFAYLDPRRDGAEPTALAFANAVLQRRRATDPLQVPAWLTLVAFREFQAGSWPAARANAAEAISLARDMRLRTDERSAMNTLALLAAPQGRFDELEELTGPGSPPAPGVFAVTLAWARGLGALGAGRPEEALALLDLNSYEDGRREALLSRWQIADLVEAAVQAGRPEVAEPALASFEPWVQRGGSAIARALAARARGLLAKDDEAEQWLRAALALHDQAFRPFERARTELAVGEALRRARRRTDAREPLRAALHEFERLGATPWAERARAELRATGESFRRRDPTALETLTPQEYQVARFVAAGGTNRDVAAQLFLSHRTVSYHLHNVYRKLGVASRTELARVDFERGLETPVR